MKGFSTRNLLYMRKFVSEYPDIAIVQTVFAQLTWNHIVTLIEQIADLQIRLFYANHAIEHGWSRNVMVVKLERALYNRQGHATTNFEQINTKK